MVANNTCRRFAKVGISEWRSLVLYGADGMVLDEQNYQALGRKSEMSVRIKS